MINWPCHVQKTNQKKLRSLLDWHVLLESVLPSRGKLVSCFIALFKKKSDTNDDKTHFSDENWIWIFAPKMLLNCFISFSVLRPWFSGLGPVNLIHLRFWIFASKSIKTDLSGNTFWPQAAGFQNSPKIDHSKLSKSQKIRAWIQTKTQNLHAKHLNFHVKIEFSELCSKTPNQQKDVKMFFYFLCHTVELLQFEVNPSKSCLKYTFALLTVSKHFAKL